jgi:hypothetical protein
MILFIVLFMAMCASTKTLPVTSQHMVRTQVFNTVSDAEAASRYILSLDLQ